MNRVGLAALALVTASLPAMVAMGQPVPLPTPAPQPKIGSAQPAPPRPPEAVPAPPRTGGAAPTTPRAAEPLTLGSQSQAAASGSILPSFRLPWATGRGNSTTAFDANQRALIERANTYLTSVQTLIGDFAQVGPDGSKSEGKFYLQKPGRIRFEYNPPSVIELIADGQSLVVRDRKLATQDVYPLSQTPLRFLLADRIDLLRDTTVVSVKADDVFISVTIEEKQTFGGTHRLTLMFNTKDSQLRQWTVTDPQGYDTTVAVYNLDNSKRLDPGLFKINYERMIQ